MLKVISRRTSRQKFIHCTQFAVWSISNSAPQVQHNGTTGQRKDVHRSMYLGRCPLSAYMVPSNERATRKAQDGMVTVVLIG